MTSEHDPRVNRTSLRQAGYQRGRSQARGAAHSARSNAGAVSCNRLFHRRVSRTLDQIPALASRASAGGPSTILVSIPGCSRRKAAATHGGPPGLGPDRVIGCAATPSGGRPAAMASARIRLENYLDMVSLKPVAAHINSAPTASFIGVCHRWLSAAAHIRSADKLLAVSGGGPGMDSSE